MLKGSKRKLAAFGITCTMMIMTAAPSSGTQQSSLGQGGTAPSLSKLTQEQLSHHVSSRYYVSQDFARTINRDPLSPGRSYPSYTYLGYEHFPHSELSYGLVIPIVYEKFNFSRFRGHSTDKNLGILPYFSYLVDPNWLVTGEVGMSLEDYNAEIFTSTPTFRVRNQVFGHEAAGFVTWIGPDTPYTATIRAGLLYSNQRFRRTIDNFGGVYPVRHFETGTFALSARLKYYPPDHNKWNAFIHLQTDFRFFATARPLTFHPDSGRQNSLLQFGPGFHYNLNDTWEVRGMLLHTAGFGYAKENRVGLRLRAVM